MSSQTLVDVPATGAPAHPDTGGAGGGRPRVLIVEDNPANRKLAQQILHIHGFDTLVATDGEEGVALAMGEPIDLVLMDIQLPRLDGVSATRRIRQRRNAEELPIVALTALAHPHELEEAQTAGCNTHLTKPYRMTDLMRVVRAALGITPDP